VKVFCDGQVRTAGHGIVGGLGGSEADDGMRPKSGGSLQERPVRELQRPQRRPRRKRWEDNRAPTIGEFNPATD